MGALAPEGKFLQIDPLPYSGSAAIFAANRILVGYVCFSGERPATRPNLARFCYLTRNKNSLAMRSPDSAVTCPRIPSLALVILKQVGKLLLESFNLWPVAHQNIWIVRMMQSVVLMVSLSVVEALQRRHLGHDRLLEYPGRIELRNVFRADLPLFLVGIEDCRPV